MNKFITLIAMSTMLALGMTAVVSAADVADPAIGTWKLNLDKSKFAAGRAPKSMTRTYAAVAGGTSMTVAGVAADGSPISQSATLTYDGKDVAVTGAGGWDTLSAKKVNGTTVKAELKKGGKVVGHSTRVVSG